MLPKLGMVKLRAWISWILAAIICWRPLLVSPSRHTQKLLPCAISSRP
jgi:hypothetical protein